MSISRLARMSERRSLRAADLAGLAACILLLACLMGFLTYIVPKLRPVRIEPTAQELAEAARKAALKVALAHREGSVLFVAPEACEEHSFDNWTGALEFKAVVDCDARLEQLRKDLNDKAAERMRSVVEGFRR